MLEVCFVWFGSSQRELHESRMASLFKTREACLADYMSTSDASTASGVSLDTEAEVELCRLDSHVLLSTA